LAAVAQQTVSSMKRPLLFRLVAWWCVFYTFISWLRVVVLFRAEWPILLLANAQFGLLLAGTIGVYGRRRWAAWLCCAVTFGLLTLDIPFGYRWAISRGGYPGRLLVLFSGLAVGNIVATACLGYFGYQGYPPKTENNLGSS
jgi:hypothetical protein